MKILEELWYGNIRPAERSFPKSKRIAELTRILSRQEETLRSLLPEDAKELYEKMKDNQLELWALNECKVYQIGFHTGAKMMQEVMEGVEENFTTEL